MKTLRWIALLSFLVFVVTTRAHAQLQPTPVFGVKAPFTFINGAVTSSTYWNGVNAVVTIDVSAYSTISVTMRKNGGFGCGPTQNLSYSAASSAAGPFFSPAVTNSQIAISAGDLQFSFQVVSPFARLTLSNAASCNYLITLVMASLPVQVTIDGPLRADAFDPIASPSAFPNPVITGLIDFSSAANHAMVIGGAMLPISQSNTTAMGAAAVAGFDGANLQPIHTDASGNVIISGSASTTTASTFAASEKLMLTASAVSLLTADVATRWVLVTNMGPNPIEIGPASVTYGTGSPVPANGGERSIDCVSPCVLYGITVTGNQVAGLGTRVMVGSHP
jgi:hypothetical protein